MGYLKSTVEECRIKKLMLLTILAETIFYDVRYNETPETGK